jgi:peptidoglycan/xylan/chitin deacetylase (PgdA/CDA1 family)
LTLKAMRLDRFMTLYLVRPIIGARDEAFPILMYHAISDDGEAGVSPYYRTNTSPAVFERHLRCLNAEGFKSVDLDEAVRSLQQKKIKKEKLVVITFDDGFRDFGDIAFPLLKKHGHTATMFLPSAFIGSDRRNFKDRECLTWNEVRDMRKQGIRFGSHTVNHPKLYQLSWKEIENELALSKEQLERELGEEVAHFAYPYAFPQQDKNFTEKFTALLRGQGYRSCVTTMVGRAQSGDDAFRLKRLPANACDDDVLLSAKLNGAYDWLATPQSWSKTARHWLGGAASKGSRVRGASPSFPAPNS